MRHWKYMPGEYIGHIEIPPGVQTKIQSKHGVTSDDVRAACSSPVRAGWHTDPKHGTRLLVIGAVRDRRLKVILHPIDITDGTWRLRTAFWSSR